MILHPYVSLALHVSLSFLSFSSSSIFSSICLHRFIIHFFVSLFFSFSETHEVDHPNNAFIKYFFFPVMTLNE